MVPGSPELWFVVLLAVVLSVPVLLALLAFLNRAGGGNRATEAPTTGEDRDEELARLRRRVDELAERVERLEAERGESEQDDLEWDESKQFGTEWE